MGGRVVVRIITTGGTGSLAQYVQEDVVAAYGRAHGTMPPSEDEDRWIDASIAHARAALAEFLH
jgi:hypothetical protein